jgi:hypothetical protein
VLRERINEASRVARLATAVECAATLAFAEFATRIVAANEDVDGAPDTAAETDSEAITD